MALRLPLLAVSSAPLLAISLENLRSLIIPRQIATKDYFVSIVGQIFLWLLPQNQMRFMLRWE